MFAFLKSLAKVITIVAQILTVVITVVSQHMEPDLAS